MLECLAFVYGCSSWPLVVITAKLHLFLPFIYLFSPFSPFSQFLLNFFSIGTADSPNSFSITRNSYSSTNWVKSVQSIWASTSDFLKSRENLTNCYKNWFVLKKYQVTDFKNDWDVPRIRILKRSVLLNLLPQNRASWKISGAVFWSGATINHTSCILHHQASGLSAEYPPLPKPPT